MTNYAALREGLDYAVTLALSKPGATDLDAVDAVLGGLYEITEEIPGAHLPIPGWGDMWIHTSGQVDDWLTGLRTLPHTADVEGGEA